MMVEEGYIVRRISFLKVVVVVEEEEEDEDDNNKNTSV